MFKFLISISFVALLLNGCGVSNGIGIGKQEVKSYFKKGVLISSNKVLVDKTKVVLLQGLTGGAVVGTAFGSVQGTFIGGTAGALTGVTAGYIYNGNEEEAYEIIIRAGLDEYKAYIKEPLPLNVSLEFVVRDDLTVTNLRAINYIKPKKDDFDEEEDY